MASGSGTTTGFRREVVASFSSYIESQRAVDQLARAGFPAERVRIVGQGLRIVTGENGGKRWSPLIEAILTGAIVGALLTLLAVLAEVGAAELGTSWTLSGIACGALGAAAAHIFSRGRRGPAPGVRLFADRYDLTVDPGLAEEAADAIDAGNGSGEPRGY